MILFLPALFYQNDVISLMPYTNAFTVVSCVSCCVILKTIVCRACQIIFPGVQDNHLDVPGNKQLSRKSPPDN